METTIQDLPGRTLGLGIPRSGSMDNLSFAIGNLLVGNAQTVEGLETVIVPGVGCAFHFYIPTVVAVAGKDVLVKINGTSAPMWSRLIVPANGILLLEARPLSESSTGFRTYLCIRGGFPDVPVYLGSKSTSMGLGGYQVSLKFAYKVSFLFQLFPSFPISRVVHFYEETILHWAIVHQRPSKLPIYFPFLPISSLYIQIIG